jgi:hypothetical protein
VKQWKPAFRNRSRDYKKAGSGILRSGFSLALLPDPSCWR